MAPRRSSVYYIADSPFTPVAIMRTPENSRITVEPGKRGGQPCVRGLRITVYDVLGWLASGMSEDEILDDHPDLERDDIRACLAFAADRERRVLTSAA